MGNLLLPLLSNDHSKDLSLVKLPIEIHFHVFKYMDLDDVWMLRLISKNFYSIVHSYVHDLKELSIERNTTYYLNFNFDGKCNWFSTAKPINVKQHIHYSRFSILKDQSDIFQKLKRLKICRLTCLSMELELSIVNKFSKLQILEIDGIEKGPHSHLQLPELKALSVKTYGESCLMADLQNLRILNTNRFGAIKLTHPLSVKHLRIDYGNVYSKDLSFGAFGCLESLECLEIADSGHNILSINHLLPFRKLKTLKINNSREIVRTKELYKWKERLMDHLDVVFYGVKIRKMSKLDEYERSGDLKFQIDNFNELENSLEFIKEMSYNHLIALGPDHPPIDLLNKYVNIQLLEIESRIDDENRLLTFINGCPNLYKLNISKSSLSQRFYDQLPSVSSIFILKIESENGINIDFDFIMKMLYLRMLSTDQDVLISKKLNLNNFKHFKRLNFRIKHSNIHILKWSNDKFSLEGCGNFHVKSIDCRKFACENLGLDLIFMDYFDLKALIGLCNHLRNRP